MIRCIFLILLIGCGVEVDVKDSKHTVVHEFDFSGIIEICEQQNATNEEIEACIDGYKKLLNID